MTAGEQEKPKYLKERRFPRYQVDLEFQAISTRAGMASQTAGRSLDISEGGLGGTLTADLTPGEIITLRFSLPHSRGMLELRATVRYRAGFHYGFEFLALSPQQRDAVRRICRTSPLAE